MKKYQIEYWSDKIREVEAVRETDHFMFVVRNGKEYREKKNTGYYKVFDSWEQAQDFLVKRTQSHIENLRSQIEREGARLATIVTMQKP